MKIKRILSAFLAGAVVPGSMAIPAFADETTGTTETTKVAKVGDTQYATLQEAVAAAGKGDTVTLIKDAVITSTYKIEGKKVVIDFGEHFIDVTAVDVNTNSIGVAADSSVYFKGNGGIKANKNCITNNGGTVTISGGEYSTQLVGKGIAI